MKAAAILLSALAVTLGDVTPRSSSFNPRRLGEERSFAAGGLWLVGPGGRYIATATGTDSFGLIDVATGRDLGAVGEHTGTVRHDGNWGQSERILATCAMDGSVKVWDATTRKEIAEFKSPHPGYT